MPGVIPTSRFIKWESVDAKVSGLRPAIELYDTLKKYATNRESFVKELADCLLSADDPGPFISCGFELLAHTDNEIATRESYISLPEVAAKISNGNEESALDVAGLLYDLGLGKILCQENLGNVLYGVQIGLETHRRKNVGGEEFKKEVETLLGRIVGKVAKRVGDDVKLLGETTIRYGKNLSKRVDMAIKVRDEVLVGIEVNFYTSSGSKPTEIKRSYADVQRGLASVGVELVWITDGKGYRRMERSLRDAFEIMPNIYNLKQASDSLEDDLADHIASTRK